MCGVSGIHVWQQRFTRSLTLFFFFVKLYAAGVGIQNFLLYFFQNGLIIPADAEGNPIGNIDKTRSGSCIHHEPRIFSQQRANMKRKK